MFPFLLQTCCFLFSKSTTSDTVLFNVYSQPALPLETKVPEGRMGPIDELLLVISVVSQVGAETAGTQEQCSPAPGLLLH